MLAFISGRHDTAVVRSNDSWHTVTYGDEVPVDGVSQEAAIALVGQIGDMQPITVESVANAQERLEQLVDQTEALDLFLILLNAEYSSETRKSSVEELEELLQYDEIRDHMQNILSASPLPTQADVDKAWSMVTPNGLTAKFLKTIVNLQPVITRVRNAWHAIDPSEIKSGHSKADVQRVMAQQGLFRVLVDDVSEQRRTLTKYKFAVLQNDTIKELVTNPASFVNQFADILGHVRVTKSDFQSGPEIDTKKPFSAASKHQHPMAARDSAISQVERISELFCGEQTEQAEKMLAELTTEQKQYPDGESHLVKSLCNIAQAVSKRGLSDISLSCLNQALQYRTGIDARLLQQLGHELRQIREYEKALECFQQAQSLEQDEDRLWRLKSDCVKILADKGRYSEAKTEFRAMLEMRRDVDTLCDLGTVYRKNGDLREARESFDECLLKRSDMHRAKAGLAEIAKQSGNPHKAIGRYNSLMREAVDIDMGARRVYELSLSALFRRTAQFSKAQGVLQGLLDSSPGDSQANYQFAKLLLLQGKAQDARSHFAKASRSPSFDVSSLLISTMLGTANSSESAMSNDTIVMPEDRGTIACLNAYQALKTEDFDKVGQIVQDGSYVDRGFMDLATVLRFHAERRLRRTDYRDSYRLCRIAKRGDRGLRSAIKELACDRFDNADLLEKEFFLRAA